MHTKVNLKSIPYPVEGILTLALSSKNKYVVSGSFDKSIKIFDLETRQEAHHFDKVHQGNLSG